MFLIFCSIVFYILKKCVTDDGCNKNECCTPTLNLGNRCRGHMTEGTICSSFTEVKTITKQKEDLQAKLVGG